MVAEIADRVVVMGEGRVVEEQTVFGLFAEPGEDYTRTLLAAVPRLPPVSSRGEEPAPVAEVDAVSPGGAEAELATEATGDDQTTVRQEDHAGEVDASDDESADLTDDSDDDVPTEPSDRSVHRILRRVVVRGPAVVAEKGGGEVNPNTATCCGSTTSRSSTRAVTALRLSPRCRIFRSSSVHVKSSGSSVNPGRARARWGAPR